MQVEPAAGAAVPGAPAGGAAPGGWGPRLLGFAAAFFVLQWGYALARGTWLEALVIERLTVLPAATLLDAFWPALGVEARGPRLAAPGIALNVLNGCEGTDAAFLLVAGMLVAPLGRGRRLAGIALGLALVFVLNVARMVALFHAFRLDPLWFERLHGVLLPLGLVVAVGAFFAAWISAAAPTARPAP